MPGVEVWWGSVGGPPLDRSTLSATELDRVGRFRSADRAERSVLARVMLRRALAERLAVAPRDVPIDWRGGPAIETAPPLWLSLSHSADTVVVAISDVGPMGIDIEDATGGSAVADAVVRAAFTEAERAQLSLPTESLQAWTFKEALLKATRDGLAVDPFTVELEGLPAAPRVVRFDARPEVVGRAVLLPLTMRWPDYAGSVAVLGDAPVQVIERDWSSIGS